ncbi:hypothetical protein [Micromonospora aurantiaca]|uniref:hypothetical protein n=1 Tax=Micromonospora aurantiaca (nom. illeg.) TaxID=47850 RepID=UPI001E59C315|nr:hypothetical protein [Micromonospora aurantiaca]UFN96785.1 hypothetical protein LF814_11900 [Micromonospora aurantiaca]
MPYSSVGPRGNVRYEMASKMGYLPTATNATIRERLALYKRPETQFDATQIERLVSDATNLDQPTSPKTRYIVAVDGSGHEIQEAFDRYPSTRVLYMQVAGVFINLQHLLDQPGHFVDPARIADAIESSVVSGFLPGSYLEHEEYTDPQVAFRAELFELFARTEVQHRTLLELLHLISRHGQEEQSIAAEQGYQIVTKCPDKDCDLHDPKAARPGIKVPWNQPGFCPKCKNPLWATDALRIWEAFQPDASNGEALGRTHQLIEHLVLLGVALSFEELSPKMLQHTAFICDGDLAVFGQAARFQRCLRGAWQALNMRARVRGHQPPIVFGVAKSGYPVEHLHGIRRFIKRRQFMRLDHEYMTGRLRISSLDETYFGRKLYYHADDGQLLCITILPDTDVAYDTKREAPNPKDATPPEDLSLASRFVTLRRTLEALDLLGTRLYDDALIPVSLAHHWAAYPLANAERVLRVLTEQSLGKTEKG